MKLSFKQDAPPTGLMNIGWIPSADIKADGEVVGFISPPSGFGTQDVYTIYLRIRSESGSFDNKCLKQTFPYNRREGMKDAKKWVRENWEAIQKLNLYTDRTE